MNSALKKHGGKFYLAKQIVAARPTGYTKFLDAYFGAGSVLINMPCVGISEWANDLDGDLINFWCVLRDTPNEILRVLLGTQFSQVEFMDALKLAGGTFDSDLKRAANFFTRNRMSRQGKGDSYATPTSRQRRGMNEHVSAYWGAIEGLPELHERLRRVEIWQRPAVEAIKKLDSAKLFVYCDPPYMHEARSTKNDYGEHEMSDEQHEELLKCLATMKGRFLLSGYHTPMYDSFADVYDWKVQELQVPNSASGAKTKEIKTECLWSNY